LAESRKSPLAINQTWFFLSRAGLESVGKWYEGMEPRRGKAG
jgi:hypothetical protein